MKNIIRLCCAKAYSEEPREDRVIPVKLSHLSVTQEIMLGNESVPYVNQDIRISAKDEESQFISASEQISVYFPETILAKAVRDYLEKKDIQRAVSQADLPGGQSDHRRCDEPGNVSLYTESV